MVNVYESNIYNSIRYYLVFNYMLLGRFIFFWFVFVLISYSEGLNLDGLIIVLIILLVF